MLASSEKELRWVTVGVDQIALVLSVVLAAVLRGYLPHSRPFSPYVVIRSLLAVRSLAFCAVWYFSMSSAGAYSLKSLDSWGWWKALKGTVIFVLLTVAIAFFKWDLFSRGAVAIFVVVGTLCTAGLRTLAPFFLRLLGGREHVNNVLLIGDGKWAKHLFHVLRVRFGYKTVHRASLVSHGISSIEAETETLIALLDTHHPDHVIFAFEQTVLERLSTFLNVCTERRIPWHFVPTVDQLVFGDARTDLVAGIPIIGMSLPKLSGLNLLIKRAIDVSLASIIVLGTAPIMAAVWLAIRLNSPGKAIFVQPRIGRDGKVFPCFKFRTMYVASSTNSHEAYAAKWIQNEHYAEDGDKKIFKLKNDPRITPVGKFLRRYSLDELPQIFNVLRGDMSLVGPRPALGYEVDLYKEWHRERLLGIPGLTGEWQVSERYSVTFDEMVKLDIEYLRNWTPARDFKVLLKTIPTVLHGTGR